MDWMGKVLGYVAGAFVEILARLEARRVVRCELSPSQISQVTSRRRRSRHQIPPTVGAARHAHPSSQPLCEVCARRACDDHCPGCWANVHTGTHTPECPEVTNLFRVNLGESVSCFGCEEDFDVGDYYTFVEDGDGHWIGMCLGCGARAVFGTGFTT